MVRPFLYQTPEDLEAKVREYQADCVAEENPVTVTGLVLYLGFRSKQSLYNQAQRTDNQSDGGLTWGEVIDYACLLFEHEHEKGLHKGGNAGGHIFGLMNADKRNREGWQNKQQQEVSGPNNGPIEVSDTDKAKRIAALLAAAEQRKQDDQGGTEGE